MYFKCENSYSHFMSQKVGPKGDIKKKNYVI